MAVLPDCENRHPTTSANPIHAPLPKGHDGPEVVERARELGLDPIIACSIIDVGLHPDEIEV